MNKSLWIIIAIVILTLVGFAWSQFPVQSSIDQFREWITSLGATGVIMFVLLYVLVTIIVGPATALTLMAGFAYGAWGFPLVVGSATLGAAVAFFLGRYLARDRVNQWIKRDRRLVALNHAVSAEGWRVVGLLRLSPLIPYGMQNYLLSVTQIDFIPFVLATLFGVMPATALYVYIGSLGQSLSDGNWLQWILAAAGLLATVLVVWIVGKRTSAAIARYTDAPNASH